MEGKATSSHAWTLTRSNAGKSVQPKSLPREMEEGQSPNTPLMPISEDLSQHYIIDSFPSFHELVFLYIRKKKISFSSIFLSSSGLQSSPRRKLQDSTSDQCYHIWSLSLLPPMGPTAIAAFSWKRLCSISENKITNFIPKISQQSSVSVPHLQLDESEREESLLQDPRMWLGRQQQSLQLCSFPKSATQPSSPPLGTVEMGHHLLHTAN